MSTKSNKITGHRCDFCNALEEKKCPIGGFMIKLKPIYEAGSKRLACQSCMQAHFKIIQPRKNVKKSKLSSVFWG